MSNSSSRGYNAESTVQPRRGLRGLEIQDLVDEALYESDEFRMYRFKITLCPRFRSHDWTSCPFAHRGEKARRRDPCRYNYAAIPCPDFKMGICARRDACQFAHGVFEYWLHPARYRTRLCHSGASCRRKVCFFAHTPEQRRPETKYRWCYVYRPAQAQPYAGIDVGGESTGGVVVPYTPQRQTAPVRQSSHARPNTNVNPVILGGLASLDKRESTSSHEASCSSLRWPQVRDQDLPDIHWVSELIDET